MIDLKRLPFQKMNMEEMKNMALDVPGLISRDDILYLLARLEAAERYAWAYDKAEGVIDRGFAERSKEAWRKSKGESGGSR